MAKQFTILAVEHRENKAIESISKLRKMNYIPAIVFGDDQKSDSIKITSKNWKQLEDSKQLIFSVENGKKNELVSLSSVDTDHFGKIVHLSLHRVKRNTLTEVMIPIQLIGERKITETSLIQQHLSEIKVSAIPTNIPTSFEVDITNIAQGDIVRVCDLNLPKDVEILNDIAQEVVLECHAPTVVQEVEAETETLAEPEKKE